MAAKYRFLVDHYGHIPATAKRILRHGFAIAVATIG